MTLSLHLSSFPKRQRERHVRGMWGRKEGRERESEREKPLSHHVETNFVINKCEVVSIVSGVGAG